MNMIAKVAVFTAIQVGAAVAITAGTLATVNGVGKLIERRKDKDERTLEEKQNNVVSIQKEEEAPEEEGAH